GPNNIQGLAAPHTNADSNEKPTLHSLKVPEVRKRQEAYVRKVVDTVNGFDNVLYEIINEGGTVEWQNHMIRFVKDYERTKPRQHPVGFTHAVSPKMWNEDLFASPADWVSPAKQPADWEYPGSTFLEHYEEDPPANDGRKVILLDTDHLWGHGGTPQWVWKAFTRGHNPIFMDSWAPIAGTISAKDAPWMVLKGGIQKNTADYPDWAPVREQMGRVARLAARLNLAAMTPGGHLSSSRYCLAQPGHAYVVYLPAGGRVTLDLRGGPGADRAGGVLPRPGP
ncbi:MAG TPA: hypothetical protein DEH78_09460, partial [Solibacterales bacterium]|nr:hypothetical protein [Bryobacterales bacterium]